MPEEVTIEHLQLARSRLGRALCVGSCKRWDRYLGYDRRENRLYEVRYMVSEADLDFIREVEEAVLVTSHPSFIKVFGEGKDATKGDFFLSEVGEGEPLKAYRARVRKALPIEAVFHLALEMAMACLEAIRKPVFAAAVDWEEPDVVLRPGGNLGLKFGNYSFGEGRKNPLNLDAPETVQWILKLLKDFASAEEEEGNTVIAARAWKFHGAHLQDTSPYQLKTALAHWLDEHGGRWKESAPVVSEKFHPQNRFLEMLLGDRPVKALLKNRCRLHVKEAHWAGFRGLAETSKGLQRQVYLLPASSLLLNMVPDFGRFRSKIRRGNAFTTSLSYMEEGRLGMLVEEACHGFTLETLVRERGKVRPDLALNILKKLDAALQESIKDQIDISTLSPDHIWVEFRDASLDVDAVLQGSEEGWSLFNVKIHRHPSMRSLVDPFSTMEQDGVRVDQTSVESFVSVARVLIHGFAHTQRVDLWQAKSKPLVQGAAEKAPASRSDVLDLFATNRPKVGEKVSFKKGPKRRPHVPSAKDSLTQSTERADLSVPAPVRAETERLRIQRAMWMAIGAALAAFSFVVFFKTKPQGALSMKNNNFKKVMESQELRQKLNIQVGVDPHEYGAPSTRTVEEEITNNPVAVFAMEEAVNHLRAGRVTPAMRVYLDLAKQYRTSGALRSGIGKVLLAMSERYDLLRYDLALREITENFADEGFVSARRTLALFWANNGSPAQAIKHLQAARRLSSEFNLELNEVSGESSIPEEGQSLVFVGVQRKEENTVGEIWVRIFDEDGERVSDRSMASLIQGDALDELEDLLEIFVKQRELSEPDKTGVLQNARVAAGFPRRRIAEASVLYHELQIQMATSNEDRAAAYAEGFSVFNRSRNEGISRANYYTAKCLLEGYGIQRNQAAAVYLLQQSSVLYPERDCFELLGECYLNGWGVEEVNPLKAAAEFRRAANWGDVSAVVKLAKMHKTGYGEDFPRDEATALDGFIDAAGLGDPEAYRELGLCYLEGVGIEKDLDRAIQLLDEAAQRGDQLAQLSLADIIRTEWPGTAEARRIPRLLKDASEGEGFVMRGDALFRLGNLELEKKPAERDMKLAESYYQQGVDVGHPECMYALGLILARGEEEVPKDLVKAASLFMRAANLGDVDAMVAYAYCLEKGQGTDLNEKDAMVWFIEAAKRGNEDAVFWCDMNDVKFREKGL